VFPAFSAANHKSFFAYLADLAVHQYSFPEAVHREIGEMHGKACQAKRSSGRKWEQYILHNRFSVEKMTLETPGDTVLFRSRIKVKIHRNCEVFTPADFLAAITQHIPDKGGQMVRYYGWHLPDYEKVLTD
jgi:hypothetical protein